MSYFGLPFMLLEFMPCINVYRYCLVYILCLCLRESDSVFNKFNKFEPIISIKLT